MIKGWILVMIYSGLTIVTEPRDDLKTCLADAASKIGQHASIGDDIYVTADGKPWRPTVQVAFCVQGASEK